MQLRIRHASRLSALVFCCVALAGCGAYKMTYVIPSKMKDADRRVQKEHAHGMGPLAVGGGLVFFLLKPISPALADYTGPVEARGACESGFAKVEQYQTTEQTVGAGFLSWLFVANWYERSSVDWYCTDTDMADTPRRTGNTDPVVYAKDPSWDETRATNAPIDLVLIRPITLSLLAIGVATYPLAGAVSLIGGTDGAKATWEQLVVGPARETFLRPLGADLDL